MEAHRPKPSIARRVRCSWRVPSKTAGHDCGSMRAISRSAEGESSRSPSSSRLAPSSGYGERHPGSCAHVARVSMQARPARSSRAEARLLHSRWTQGRRHPGAFGDPASLLGHIISNARAHSGTSRRLVPAYIVTAVAQKTPQPAQSGVFSNDNATVRLAGASLLEPSDKWRVQNVRCVTLEIVGQLGDDALISLPPVVRESARPVPETTMGNAPERVARWDPFSAGVCLSSGTPSLLGSPSKEAHHG